MLQVFDAEIEKADIVDIDAAFSKLEIPVDESVKNIIKAVEQGNMIDTATFVDRFGVKLYLSELSTGCKAAICVALKPDKIILWLAKEQFNGVEVLPSKLQALQERGLTIRFCDDVKSHKKYLYAMQEYPNDIIILVDDDSFYPLDTIEKLYEMYKNNPTEISCMTPTLISDFNELPSKWERPHECSEVTHSYLAQPYTGQGTLFPPHCLDEKYAFDKDLIMQLCPFADDLWLKYMSLRKKTRVSTFCELRDLPVTIYGTQDSSLWYINGQDGKNDMQWQNLLDYFHDDFSQLGHN